MAETFGDLGLSEKLVEAAQSAGYDRPTALQDAAVPVLRRGANVVLLASSGAGVTAAFTLGLLDRLLTGEAGGAGPRALVLAPTAESAAKLVNVMGQFGEAAGISVRSLAAGWRPGADVLVTTVRRALDSVQTSGLKLDATSSLVVFGADDIMRLGDGERLGTLGSLLPAEGQRVVITAALDDAVKGFIETHVRRPLTVPARPADRAVASQHREPIGQIGYMVLSAEEKPELLARLLDGVHDALVVARTTARAQRIARDLARRGIDDDIAVTSFHGEARASDRIVSYDVPFSAADLKRFHETGGTVFVTADELSHFKRIAAEVPFTLKQRRARTLDSDELDAFRSVVRAALESEDIGAQMLVLDPLFEEHSPVEVAAALSGLLRRRATVSLSPDHNAAGSPPKEAQTASGLTRLFVSIGTRDNVRPGDLVGAITGEANIKGDQVGLVDIRESFSVVEVAADVAERVIRALNGTAMKGRSLRVDFDRKNAGGRGDDKRPRGTSPRGPAGGSHGPSHGPRDTGPPRRPGGRPRPTER